MTKTITTAEINDRLQKGMKMSRAEMTVFLMKTRQMFEASYQIQKLIIKHENPDIANLDCNIKAFETTWELMKSLGYVHSSFFRGWIFPNMQVE